MNSGVLQQCILAFLDAMDLAYRKRKETHFCVSLSDIFVGQILFHE